MIKLTRLDGEATFMAPEHIVSVTTGRSETGDTMTCVYTTALHEKGQVEFVKEAPRHVARMCENYILHSVEALDEAIDEQTEVAEH